MTESPTVATVTAVVAEVVPVGLVAVSVYMVVLAGETEMEFPVTTPTPGLIETLVAPATVQVNEADCPLVILAGLAVNDPIVGPDVAATMTVAVAVLLPAELLAVRV